MAYIKGTLGYHLYSSLIHEISMEHSITTIKDDHMGSGEYYLNSLRNAEPQSINIVLIDTKMLDTTSKW